MTEVASNAVSPHGQLPSGTSSLLHRPLPCPTRTAGLGHRGHRLVGGEQARKKADQFLSQDCLYSLTVAPAKGDTVCASSAPSSTTCSHRSMLDEVLLLTDPALRIVTLTITEGGYRVDPGSGAFVTEHPNIARDLAGEGAPRTVFGFVTAARRRSAGTKPFTVVSCDNLRHNGEVARAAFVAC